MKTKSILIFFGGFMLILTGIVYRVFYYIFFNIENKGKITEIFNPERITYYDKDFFLILMFKENPISLIVLFPFLFFVFFKNKRNIISKDLVKLFHIPALILVLYLISSGYNFYSDSLFLFEKITIIILLILSFYKSIFFLLLFPSIWAVLGYLNYGFGVFTLVDKSTLLMTLSLFYSIIIVEGLLRVLKVNNEKYAWHKSINDIALLLIIGIVCSGYFTPFIEKIRITGYTFEWPLIENFSLAAEKYFARGHLNSISLSSKKIIIQFLSNYSTILLSCAFIIEMLGLFCFYSKRWIIFMLGTFSVLNLSIYILSGIFFWKWILFNTSIIIFLIWKKEALAQLQGKYLIGISFMLMSTLFLNMPRLGWFSTNYFESYYLNVKTSSGDFYSVNPNSIKPYNIFMSFPRWDLSESGLVNETTNPSQLLYTLEDFQNRKHSLNEEAMKILSERFNKYFSNLKKNGSSWHPNLVPNHINSFPGEYPEFDMKKYSEIEEITIVKKECLFLNDSKVCDELYLEKIQL